MKTVKEYLVQLMDGETPAFVRVFEALPADKMDWKPDPKAATALERSLQMAMEAMTLLDVFKTGILNYDPTAMPNLKNPAEIAAAFKDGMMNAKTAVMAMSDADWDSEAKMMMGDVEAWKATRGEMGLGIMLDLIHHRGQLSTYIRPMGGKVPSIYGPSADAKE